MTFWLSKFLFIKIILYLNAHLVEISLGYIPWNEITKMKDSNSLRQSINTLRSSNTVSQNSRASASEGNIICGGCYTGSDLRLSWGKYYFFHILNANKNNYKNSLYLGSSIVLRDLHILTHLILATILWDRPCSPYFSKKHGLKPRQCDSRAQFSRDTHLPEGSCVLWLLLFLLTLCFYHNQGLCYSN